METKRMELEELKNELGVKFAKLTTSTGYKLACIEDKIIALNHSNLVKLIKALKDNESQFIPNECEIYFKSILKIIDKYINTYTKNEELVTDSSIPILFDKFRSKVIGLSELLDKVREELALYPDLKIESMIDEYEVAKLSFDVIASSYDLFIKEINNDTTQATFVINTIDNIIKGLEY